MNENHVFGKISESEKFESLHPRFGKALSWLRENDLEKMPVGDYIIEAGSDGAAPTVKAMVQEANLKPYSGECCHAEAHRKYIDIQSPISGRETYGVCTLDPNDPNWSFDEAKDCGFIDCPCKKVTLSPGEFAIFFAPNGAHAPCQSEDGPRKIKKVVIKILAAKA